MQKLFIGALAAIALAGCGPSEPQTKGAPPDMRRLTEEQYQNIIADVFGLPLEVRGRFDPMQRTDGLEIVGARNARITPSGFERFYNVARNIAERVVDAEHRDVLVPCAPVNVAAADDECARKFFSQTGRLLYRRPLTAPESDFFVKAAHDGATTRKDFYRGLGMSLASLLVTPQFLFVSDTTERDPKNVNAERLTAHAKASRLSFFMWNTTPDEALLTAADSGELNSNDGLKRQVERMASSPHMEGGVRAFFSDFLSLADFDTVEKDPIIYPSFTVDLADDAKEQMLRTITDHLLVRNQDYRELFTTRQTFMTRNLARVYRVPTERTDNAWTPYEFPAEQGRAGIQSQIALMALYAYPGRSSAVRRGRAVRELLLCQRVPDPPGDVDFSVFTDPNSPNKTARERLTAHRTAPACAGCHKITDPIGLTFENFDGAGQYRTTENGAAIDASGDLDGVKYDGAVGLAKALHDDPATASCAVNRMYSYALGRAASNDDKAFVAYLEESFASDRYRITSLIQRIALSDAMFAIAKPDGSQSAMNGGAAVASAAP